MDDQSEAGPGPHDRKLSDSTERVRIIGAEEAAEAIERGDVAPRRGGAIPRFGDRPPSPPVGVRPMLRFPLEPNADATRIERPVMRPAPDPASDPADLPEWGPRTAAGSSAALAEEPSPSAESAAGLGAWSSFARTAPLWRDTGYSGETDDIDDPLLDGPVDGPNSRAVAHESGEAADPSEAASPAPTGGAGRRWARRSASGGAQPLAGPLVAGRPGDGPTRSSVPVGSQLVTDHPGAFDDVEGEPTSDWSVDDGALSRRPSDNHPSEGATRLSRSRPSGATRRSALQPPSRRPPPYDEAADLTHADESIATGLPAAAEERSAEGPVVSGAAVAQGVPWYMREEGTTPQGQHQRDLGDGAQTGDFDDTRYDESVDDGEVDALGEHAPQRRWRFPRPSGDGDDGGGGGDRTAGAGGPDRTRLIVGFTMAAVAAVLFWIGSAATMFLVVAIVTLAALEFFNALRRAGYENATLLGLAASVALPLAVYWRGLEAIPMIIALSVVFIFLWYLVGAGGHEPLVVQGAGTTLLGIAWVGVLGSFAAAMVRAHDGRGVLLIAVLATVAYDAVGFLVGQRAGKRALAGPSPNKTVEGLVAGMVACVVITVIVVGFLHIGPYDGLGAALLIGMAAAVAAPLGDLCESLVKRDLAVKDMGAILPGHGGILDRFDALLFVMPAVFYVVHAIGHRI